MDGTCQCGGHGYHSKHGKNIYQMNEISETITSSQDPGKGHELHQLAVLLPPSDKKYKGVLAYSASEDIQLVTLDGPLTEDKTMDKPIWTPDGKTKFALTLVDQKSNMGTWLFTGNALAVHAFNTEPFTVTYSAIYMTIPDGTCQCTEGCSCDQDGACICSGETDSCMCGPNCTCGADVTCQCGPNCNCGK
jgi:hypothetical protein